MVLALVPLALSAAWAGPESAPASDGRAVYTAKCQACHGASGRGDGPAARALPKKPRDFSSPEFWASTTDARVRTVITQGLPGTIMRGFPMPDPQLDALMAYLKSFAADAAPAKPAR